MTTTRTRLKRLAVIIVPVQVVAVLAWRDLADADGRWLAFNATR